MPRLILFFGVGLGLNWHRLRLYAPGPPDYVFCSGATEQPALHRPEQEPEREPEQDFFFAPRDL